MGELWLVSYAARMSRLPRLEPGSFVADMLIDDTLPASGTVTVEQDWIDVTTEADQTASAWVERRLMPGLKHLYIDVEQRLPVGPTKVRLLTEPEWVIQGHVVSVDVRRDGAGQAYGSSRIESSGAPTQVTSETSA